jgi:hypothetical protein
VARAGLQGQLAQVDSRAVSGPEKVNPYAVALDDLEHETHVPYEDQTTEQPVSTAADSDSEWDKARRQARLAGGA